jgi:hypothetical protein
MIILNTRSELNAIKQLVCHGLVSSSSHAAPAITELTCCVLQKPKVAQTIAAVFTAAVVLAAPAFAKDDAVTEKVRNAVCASNPTAKMCLRDSFTRQQEGQ